VIHLIAHDLRSRENVGALFRMADAFGVAKIWLTGYTPTPPDEKIHKTALGAETWVSWEHERSIDRAFARFERNGMPVYALERCNGAVSLRKFSPPSSIALLLGTETTGIPNSLLERCVSTLEIPQVGRKESLNVAMAAAIACWELLAPRTRMT
jgi:23S rRNA (guanosine2251-2'-O)-methyltransferase